MATLRFIVLQTILAAGLVALWLSGPLADVFAGNARWFVGTVFAGGGLGLILVAMGRVEGGAKIQDMLPVVAVVAMQLGILGALDSLSRALMSSGDPMRAVGAFFGALSIALYVSVSALIFYLWLRITLWLTHGA